MNNKTPKSIYRTVNPGDVIKPHQTLQEKAKQLAVDAPDITGDRIIVPTYFIVDYPDGEKKALHHVKDAKEISDVIRQMRLYEEDDDSLLEGAKHSSGLSGLFLGLTVFVMLFSLLTAVMLVGIF